MKRLKNGLLFILLAGFALLVASCDDLTGASASNSEQAVPIAPAQSPQMRPDEVVTGFLDAWNAQDYEAMYSYLAPQSRERYPQTLFVNRYQAVQQTIGLSGIKYTLHDTTIQGQSAAVTYDVTLQSPNFGEINDTARTIRLLTGDGWKIAWSPMDIIDGLSDGTTLQVDSRFPTRESIYDRYGRTLVESNGTAILLRMSQDAMSDVGDCMDVLSRMLLREPREMNSLFLGYNVDTVFPVGEVDEVTFNKYRADLENICGINNTSAGIPKYLDYTRRSYVGHGAAAHVTGYIGFIPADDLAFWERQGYQGTDIVGLTGIENLYQRELAGQPQRILRIIEPGGAVIRELQSASGSAPQPVTLTVDRDLQLETSQTIADAFVYAQNNWGSVATGAAAVVMDVNTGQVLAMASYPTFDPGIFSPETQYSTSAIFESLGTNGRRPLINKAIAEQYFPASTYKIITTTAAFAEGIWSDPNEIFYCDLEWKGQEKYGDSSAVRYDWRYTDKLDATGDITISQALTTSCDPFYYEMGARLFQRDPSAVVRYSELFGLGSRTGFELSEVTGNLAPPTSVSAAINNAIGQGNVQVTALQMAVLVSAVANGGTVYQPYIVRGVGEVDDTNAKQPTVVRETGIDPAALDIVRKGMCDVTQDQKYGTAESAFRGANYLVCGKTGTAQADFAPHAWFVAYAPMDNPQVAVAVVVPNSREGSEVAAPMVRRILDSYFDEPWYGFPTWWEGDYIPIEAPAGSTVGG